MGEYLNKWLLITKYEYRKKVFAIRKKAPDADVVNAFLEKVFLYFKHFYENNKFYPREILEFYRAFKNVLKCRKLIFENESSLLSDGENSFLI